MRMNNKKIRERIKNRQYENISFDDVCRFVQSLGFIFDKQDGTSHRQYHNVDLGIKLNLQKTKDGKAKGYQMRQIRDIIKKYNL